MSPPNVLLVVMDSVRARNTSLHGHFHETTPFLCKLSERATQYEQARAPSQWSLPSHTSMFTGTHVPEHGITSDGDSVRAGSTIFDELLADGYETAVFSSNPYLTSLDTGLQSGFERVAGAAREPLFDGVNPDEYKGESGAFVRDSLASGRPLRSLANGIVSKLAWDYPWLLPESLERKVSSGTVSGSTYTNLFCDWVADTSGPWAACINYMDAHHPYTPAAEFDRWNDGRLSSIQDSIRSMPLSFYTGEDPWWHCELLEYLYDGTIRQIDHEVRRVVKFLRERGELDETLLIVTSDHGEGFGERSPVRDVRIAGHNVGEHEVNLHVPLLVKYPGQRDAESTDELVSLTSIPSEIRHVVAREERPGGFEDEPVVAKTGGLREVQLNRLREKGVDVSPLEGDSSVLYAREEGDIFKWVRWDDGDVVRDRIDTDRTEVDVNERRLETTFDGFGDAGIKEASGLEPVDDATEQRLADLGYR